MTKIKDTTTKKLRKNFTHYADWVNQHQGAVVVQRQHHPNVVLVSKAEYLAWQKTLQAWSTLTQNQDLQRKMDRLTNDADLSQQSTDSAKNDDV